MAATNKEGGRKQYQLCLYVAGSNQQSAEAIVNLKLICEAHLKGRYSLTVIDLYRTPGLAREEQIVVLPTLIKREPLPVQRVVGDLSDTERVLAILGLLATNGRITSLTLMK